MVWNIYSRTQSAGNTVHQDLIWSVTSPIPGCQPNQPVHSSLFSSTEEEPIKLFSCLRLHFFIKISTVSNCLLSSGLYTTILLCREMVLFNGYLFLFNSFIITNNTIISSNLLLYHFIQQLSFHHCSRLITGFTIHVYWREKKADIFHHSKFYPFIINYSIIHLYLYQTQTYKKATMDYQ